MPRGDKKDMKKFFLLAIAGLIPMVGLTLSLALLGPELTTILLRWIGLGMFVLGGLLAILRVRYNKEFKAYEIWAVGTVLFFASFLLEEAFSAF